MLATIRNAPIHWRGLVGLCGLLFVAGCGDVAGNQPNASVNSPASTSRAVHKPNGPREPKHRQVRGSRKLPIELERRA